MFHLADSQYKGDDHCGSEPMDRIRPKYDFSKGTAEEQQDARNYYSKLIDGIMNRIK